MPSSVLLALSNTQTTWLINWPLFLSGLCFQLAQWLTFPQVSVRLQCRRACFHFVWTTTQNVTLKGIKGSKLQGIWMLWSYLPSWSFCGVVTGPWIPSWDEPVMPPSTTAAGQALSKMGCRDAGTPPQAVVTASRWAKLVSGSAKLVGPRFI